LTVEEYLRQLQYQLTSGGSGDPPQRAVPIRVAQIPEVSQDGQQTFLRAPREVHKFEITALNRYIEVIPNTFYDTVWISVSPITTNTVSYPILASLESLTGAEGVSAIPTLNQRTFTSAHPPSIVQPATENENFIKLNTPLTNSPLIIRIDDGMNPTGIDTVSVVVTLLNTGY
jgi:hypothetical protein